MIISPVTKLFSDTDIFITDIKSTGIPDFAVNDDNLTVQAVISPRINHWKNQWKEINDFPTYSCQLFKMAHFRAVWSPSINQHANFYTTVSSCDKGLC